MNSDFRNFAYARTDEALNNKKYRELQAKFLKALMEENIKEIDIVSGETEVMATELCYMQGFNDAIQLILKGARI